MNRSIPVAVAFTLCALLPASAPRAAESFDACVGFIDSIPVVLETQGVWCLRHDVATAITSGRAITIAANNVTVDCNGFKIGGLAGGIDTTTMGVHTANRLNAVVRRCNIRGFLQGIDFSGADGALIEDNRFEQNTLAGIFLNADDGVVRANRVLDTGRPSGGFQLAYGIATNGPVEVVDNSVSGVVSPGVAYGIHFSGAALVARNFVRGVVATDERYGIYAANNITATVRDNTLHGPGTQSIHCAGDKITSGGNYINGFGRKISQCHSGGNTVNAN